MKSFIVWLRDILIANYYRVLIRVVVQIDIRVCKCISTYLLAFQKTIYHSFNDKNIALFRKLKINVRRVITFGFLEEKNDTPLVFSYFENSLLIASQNCIHFVSLDFALRIAVFGQNTKKVERRTKKNAKIKLQKKSQIEKTVKLSN